MIRRLHLMNLLLATVIGVVAAYDTRSAIQLAALVGATWLATLLIVPRIMYWPVLARWHGELLDIAKMSKWMGIWTAIWFATHGVLAGFTYLGHAPTLWHVIFRKEIILAAAAIGIFALLVAISNQWSYAHVKWWKQLNMAVWAIPPLGLTHALLASGSLRGELPLFLLVPTLFLGCIVAGFTSAFGAKKVTDRWRLQYLAAGCLLALIVVFFYPKA